MASSSNLLFLLVSLAIFLPCIWCDENPDMVISRCDKVVNTNQPSPTNADKMISELQNLAPHYDFSYYTHQDTGFYGLAWCLGDAFAQNCSACLAGAAERLVNLCSHQTNSASIVFQNFCFLRVDIKDFLQTIDLMFTRYLLDNTKDQQVEEAHQVAFGDSVFELMNGLKQKASQQNKKKFARGQADFNVENSIINGMVQCVNQLSSQVCALCLQEAIDYLGTCNFGRTCQIFLGGSCILQYDVSK